VADAEPPLTEFYRLTPWDVDRLTVRQFNAYMAHRNAVIEAAQKSQGVGRGR
jgi:hypothetical protein